MLANENLNESEAPQLNIGAVSKRDLGNHLAEIIKECSDGMSKEQVNSQGWVWLASKKTLAESILIQFC